ncbi:MAG: DUF4340 domain-containing protein [Planctomycetota bacterium]
MSQNLKTIIMALFTVGLAMTAAYYYPWPEAIAESEVVGQPLFKDYEIQKARKLKIISFNEDTSKLESVEIRWKGDTWVLPDHKYFPVTNAGQNSVAVSAMVEREILQEVTDEQEMHREYGVVDPAMFSTIADKSALGTKVIVEDGTGDILANVIVGKPLKESNINQLGEIQHYVSIPGQPKVYVINLNPRAFPTDFSRWVDPNLFGLRDIPLPLNIEVTSERIAPDDFGKEPERIYRVSLQGPTQEPLNVTSFEVANKDGQFVDAVPIDTYVPQWKLLGDTIRRVSFSDVRKKTKALAKKFLDESESGQADDFEGLKEVGFMFTGINNGMPQFQSSDGRMELKFESGVRFKLLLGSIAAETTADQTELNRYVMLLGEFDESLLPELPEKPDAADESETKVYLRKVKDREEMSVESKNLIASFNERHADWVYLVSESVCNQLVPDLDISTVKPVVETASENDEDQTADPGESEKQDSPEADAPKDQDESGPAGDQSSNDEAAKKD